MVRVRLRGRQGLGLLQPFVLLPRPAAGRGVLLPDVGGIGERRQRLDSLPLLQQQVLRGRLVYLQIVQRSVLVLQQQSLHVLLVQIAIHLGPRTPHRGTLPPIQHPKVYPALVGHRAHDPAQRVDLADQVSLPDSPDGGVARQFPEGGRVLRHEQRPRSRAGGGRRRLGPGVSSPHDDHVVVAGGGEGRKEGRRSPRGGGTEDKNSPPQREGVGEAQHVGDAARDGAEEQEARRRARRERRPSSSPS
mmetsp:Transcript_39038/g.83311  ORF Transcript_39038/g.83311 Transcript_39038/m.83311 type:complete len:247 (-) Transcript_39038:158-898(-)